MAFAISNMWLRRLLAQLTTPPLVALAWALLFANGQGGFFRDLAATTLLCYLGWLMLGFPGTLARRRERPPAAWSHVGAGTAIGAMPLLMFLPGSGRDEPAFLALGGAAAAIGAAAGLWYWFCAYWRPTPGPAADRSVATPG